MNISARTLCKGKAVRLTLAADPGGEAIRSVTVTLARLRKQTLFMARRAFVTFCGLTIGGQFRTFLIS